MFVDEWVRSGLRHAVVCPGSRSTPMALALAGDGRVEVHVRLDERSAGFVALGIGLVTGVPAVLCTTSGTATAEVHAAVVEAHHARVPLVVWTADRPAELHDVGAPQTIGQQDLYGSALRWACSAEVAEVATASSWRSLASRVVTEAMANPVGPGPVHLNMALREPLLGRPVLLPEGRAAGRPWHQVSRMVEPAAAGVFDDLAFLGLDGAWVPGVLVAGAGCGEPESIEQLADRLGWPLLADPRSGCRRHGPATVVATADGLVRSGNLAGPLRPAAVVRLGAPWASKELGQWLDALAVSGVPQLMVSTSWPWEDAGRNVGRVVAAEPAQWCRVGLGLVGPGQDVHGAAAEDHAYRRRWEKAELAAQRAIDQWVAAHPQATEPGVARTLSKVVDEQVTILAGSSMPIRDLEWFGAVRSRPPAVVANRGANGIDGMVSTAMGVATAGGPVVAVVGDLGFLHDLSAWVRPSDEALDLTVVVVDNGGGGIFSFLAQAGSLEPSVFERLFATPQAVDVATAAAGLGVEVVEVDSVAGVAAALATPPGSEAGRSTAAHPRVIRVRVPPPPANVALHQSLQEAIAQAAEHALR